MSTDPNIHAKKSPADKSLMGISFHEIQSDESHEAVTAQTSKAVVSNVILKKSHLTNHGDVFDVSKAFDSDALEHGTIVTDRRNTHPSLGQNLHNAFVEWWGTTKKSLSKISEHSLIPSTEERAIQKSESRVEVLKEAATHTVQVPKDDHTVVIEKFKTYNRDVAKVTGTPFSIKPPEKKLTAWVHTESVPKASPSYSKTLPSPSVPSPDMRTTMVAPVVKTHIKEFVPNDTSASRPTPTKDTSAPFVPLVERKQVSQNVSSFSVAPLVQKASSPHISSEVFSPIEITGFAQPTVQAEETAPQSAEHAPTLLQPEPAKPPFEQPQSVEFAPSSVPESIARSVPETVFHAPFTEVHDEILSEELGETPRESIPLKRRFENVSFVAAPAADDSRRTYITLAILLGIVLLGIVLALFASTRVNVFENAPEPSTEIVRIPTFFEVDTRVPLPLSGSRETFLESFHALVLQTSVPVAHVYPTVSNGMKNVPASSAEVFTFLNTHLQSKTIRALDDTVMFGSVMTSRSEPFIILRSYNFDTLFAGLLAWEPYMHTDLQPLFGSAVPSAHFVDMVGNNASIRILYDEQGNEMLLYSFVTPQTVIITTSNAALTKLIQQF